MRNEVLRLIVWLGDSRDVVRGFPREARDRIGAELYRLQIGLDPRHWKPMQTVAPSAREIRVRAAGQFRLVYVSDSAGAIVVAHAFRKDTAKTSRPDRELARQRLVASGR